MKHIAFLLIFIFLISCAKVEIKKECVSDSDCVLAQCCHANSCISKENAPNCEGILCTQECRAGTIDCGGSCACENNKCVANLVYWISDY